MTLSPSTEARSPMTPSDKAVELAACPYCASTDTFICECEEEICSTFWGECADCGARGSISEYKDGAAQYWNKLAAFSAAAPAMQEANAMPGRKDALLPCPFCGEVPSFTTPEKKDERRYVEMKLECCSIKMAAALGWNQYKELSDTQITTRLHDELLQNWNKRSSFPAPQPDMERRYTYSCANEKCPLGGTKLEVVAPADAAALPAQERTWQPTHQHVKRGGFYQVIGKAFLQTETGLMDMSPVTVYRAEDGSLWVRGSLEFEDGRFVALPSPAPPHVAENRHGENKITDESYIKETHQS